MLSSGAYPALNSAAQAEAKPPPEYPHNPTGAEGDSAKRSQLSAARTPSRMRYPGSNGAPHMPWQPSWSGTDTAQPSARSAAISSNSSCASAPTALAPRRSAYDGKQRSATASMAH